MGDRLTQLQDAVDQVRDRNHFLVATLLTYSFRSWRNSLSHVFTM